MSQQLQQALERAQAAEKEKETLQLRINKELEPEIARLRQAHAEEETAKAAANAEASSAKSSQAKAEANAEARKTRISALEGERDRLQKRIDELDPVEIELRLKEAESMKAGRERRETFMLQLKALGIVSLLIGISFVLFDLNKVDISWTVRVLAGGTIMALAFFMPQIIWLAQKVAPHAARNSFGISLGTSAAISVLVVSLGLPRNMAPWGQILMWIVSFLGYTLLFQGAFMSVLQLIREQPDTRWRDRIAAGYFISFIMGLIGAGIYEYNSASGSASTFLLYTIIGMLISAILYVVAMLAYWGASLIGAHASGLFERERRRLRTIDKWLRAAKVICALVSVFVGYIVGSGYSYTGNGGSSASLIMAFGIGMGVTTIFYLVEGKILEACFMRRYSNGTLAVLVVLAAIFATGTAFLSFGKVYFEASRGPRFAETHKTLVDAENSYLAATEGTCNLLSSKSADPSTSSYSLSVDKMKDAIELAGRAHDRKELVESARLFQEGGAQAADCASRAKKGLLKDVVVFAEPTPSDLSSQFWFDSIIPGVQLHEGSARQATVAVAVIDFLIVILAIFGWLFSSRRRQGSEEEHTARIISVMDDGNCIIDLTGCPGVEIDDILVVVNDRNETVGSLIVTDRDNLGTTACWARKSSDKMTVEAGMLCRLTSP